MTYGYDIEEQYEAESQLAAWHDREVAIVEEERRQWQDTPVTRAQVRAAKDAKQDRRAA